MPHIRFTYIALPLMVLGICVATFADQLILNDGKTIDGTFKEIRGGIYYMDVNGAEQKFPVFQVKQFVTTDTQQPTTEFVFTNGDRLYGVLKGFADGSFIVSVNNDDRKFPISQIKTMKTNVPGPSPTEMLNSRLQSDPSVASPVQNASGALTNAQSVLMDEKEVQVNVEKDFKLKILSLKPARFGFFDQPGVLVQGILSNDSDFNYRGVEFRAYLLDAEGNQLGTQDFYMFRFPPKSIRSFAVKIRRHGIGEINNVKIVRRF